LVPIRLDLDADGYRLRDTFTWDMNNELISTDRFARSLCIDVGLPQELFVPMIVQAIEEQTDDFRQYGYAAETSDRLRVVIRIDVLVGHIALRDQFEWDIAPLLRPLQVASVLCAEKGLGGEFETAITHSIREQLYAFVKSFLLAGYTYRPRLVPKSALGSSILPPVKSALRDSSIAQTFEPLIVQLHTVDVERLEKDTDRDTRRKRRQGRGR
ncbi:SNF5-domain-containing protein, partial [Linderina pennispora]